MLKKAVSVIMLVVLLVSMQPLAFAAKFSLGDAVEVCNTGGLGLRIRDSPAGNIIGKKYDGDRGVILEGPQTAALGGIVYTWWRIRWDATTEGWSAEGEPGGVDYLVKVVVVGEPTITVSLAINPSKSEYYVGETIAASFTITNRANVPFVFDVLTAGGRDPDNQVVDFTFRTDIFLKPGESYPYEGTLTLPVKTGNYHFFCAYRRLDGSWNPAIPTEGGATNVLDITVSEQPPPPPPPYYTLTITTTVGGTTNPAPGSHLYGIGARVDVTAIPYDGYTLDHWELDTSNVGSANPFQVTMDKDHTLLAVFVAKHAEMMTKPVQFGEVGKDRGAGENFRGYYYNSYSEKGEWTYVENDPVLNTRVFTEGFHIYDSTIKVGEVTYLNYKIYHEGIDISGNNGKDVYAAASGKVIYVDLVGGSKAGKYVWIYHGDITKLDGTVESQISTRYLHLNTIDLTEDDIAKEISKGTKIGTVGQTGTYYPHLHFEVRQGDTTKGRRNTLPLNPCDFVDYKPYIQTKGAEFRAGCPVDLVITDPDGLVISKEINELPASAKYVEMKYYGNYEEGHMNYDSVIIDELKLGDYLITVVPEPEASPTDTFSIQIMFADTTLTLAENVRISDIPAEPYVFSSTALEYTISGTVRDKLGNPIPNVLIVAQDALTEIDAASAISNATGAYAMTVPSGTYNLIVTPPPESGFAPTTISNIEVAKDTVIDIVLIPVVETVVFSGQLVDRDGQPLPGQYVSLWGGAFTDDQGMFSIRVPRGMYNMEIMGDWSLPEIITGQPYPSNLPQMYSLYSTTPLNITQNTFITITLQNRYLTGKTVDPEGNSVSSVSIHVSGSTNFNEFYGGFEAWATSDSEGNFNITVFTCSSVCLKAYPSDPYAPVTMYIDVTEDKAVNVTLTRLIFVTFSGAIMDRDGNPVPYQYVNVYSSDIGIGKSAVTDDQGLFSMQVPVGSYTLSIEGYWPPLPEYEYVPNVPMNYYLYRKTAVNITEDTFMTIILQNRYLTGKIDCEGIPVAKVAIHVSGYTDFDEFYGWFESWTTTDSEGKSNVTIFTCSSVSVQATPPSPYRRASITVNATEDVFVIITLETFETVVFSGQLVDRGGVPVPAQYVRLWSAEYGRDAFTDDQGLFSMAVPPGTYWLEIMGDWSFPEIITGQPYPPNVPKMYDLSSTTPLNVTEDSFMTFTLQNRYLTGKIDCEGKPVANVSIYVNGATAFDDFSGWFETWATTDNEGKFNVTAFTSASVSIRATPPPESIYAPFSIANIDVTDDKKVLIALFYKAGVLPTANFTWNPEIPEVGQTVTFDASTSIPGSGIIIRHKWSFGDGTYAIGKVVTHSYASPGVYTVTLNVTNSKGLWDIEQKQILVVEAPPGPKPPVASFTFSPANPKVDEGATLDASASFDPDGQIVSYIWNFGDGFTGEGKIATHSYSKEGNYMVTLTAADNDGKSSSTSETLTVVKPKTDERIEDAIAWALDWADGSPYPAGGPHADEMYIGWCLAFVQDAYQYGAGAKIQRYEYAKQAADALGAENNKGVPPRGAFVFYNWYGTIDGVYQNWGHVGLSLADGQMVYAWTSGPVVASYDKIGLEYIGWAWPPLTPQIKTSGLTVLATCPVDLVITDPDYLVISKEYNEIPGAIYIEEDLNGDGSPDVYVFIPEQKIGQYLITVIPKPDAGPTATYTLEVSSDGIAFLLAENVPISDIPTEPYVLYSTTFEAPPLPTYALTITTTVGGTTDPAPGTYSYTANSTVQVTAIPEPNYLFDYWELDGVNVGSANPYAVLMDKNHTLKAVLARALHDVAVTSIAVTVPHCSSKVGNNLWVFQGLPVYVNVTVSNRGDFDENVSVTLYYNITTGEMIGTQNITILTGENRTLSFVWDTTSVPYCHNYTITAVATIPLDNNPADNTQACGPINVRIKGDINGDGVVDGSDLIIIARAFGSYGPNCMYPGSLPSQRWNLDSDINGDGVVDGSDLIFATRNFGK